MPDKKNIKVISIDPGYERVGIAVIEKIGGEKENLLFSECFKTSAKLSHDKRLALLGQEVRKIIRKYAPEDLAIEQLFFSENQKTALKVAEARGVLIYEAALQNIEVYEYTPLEVKIATTGYGRSSKEQVTAMVCKLIKIPEKVRLDDEFDAIAIGLTHTASKRFF